jgi:hypothetical protein
MIGRCARCYRRDPDSHSRHPDGRAGWPPAATHSLNHRSESSVRPDKARRDHIWTAPQPHGTQRPSDSRSTRPSSQGASRAVKHFGWPAFPHSRQIPPVSPSIVETACSGLSGVRRTARAAVSDAAGDAAMSLLVAHARVAPFSHIPRVGRVDLAVHFVAWVSGPSQHTWAGPQQLETHLLVVMSQPKPCWQLTSGPKAGTFWERAGARQQVFPSAPHGLQLGMDHRWKRDQ